MNNNENITDITEVLEKTQNSWWFDNTDVSGYKWKLVSDNQNEPTQVHFYKEDMNDTLSVSLSTIFDNCLREYEYHLEEIKGKEKRRVEEEIREIKEKLLDDKLNEVIDEYELFLKQKVKDELHKRNTNPEEDEDFDEFELKFTLTNLRKILNYNFRERYDGIHLGIGTNKQNSFTISKEWYLENFDKLNQIVLSYDPDFKISSIPIITNEGNKTYDGEFIKFMNLGENGGPGRRLMRNLYDKCILLYRSMKKSPIGYWKS